MAKKSTGLIIGGLALGGIILGGLAFGGKKKTVNNRPIAEVIRALVVAEPQDREKFIREGQELLKMKATGVFDAATYRAFVNAVDAERDSIAIMRGLDAMRAEIERASPGQGQPSEPSGDADKAAKAADVGVRAAVASSEGAAQVTQAQTPEEAAEAAAKAAKAAEVAAKAAKAADETAKQAADADRRVAEEAAKQATEAARVAAEEAERAKRAAAVTPNDRKILIAEVQRNLSDKRTDYDRELLKRAQKSVGIEADGVYGPKTRNALVLAGMPDVLLGAIVDELKTKGKEYDRPLMKLVQKSLKQNPDGFYGKRTREAFIKAGAPDDIPAPMFGTK